MRHAGQSRREPPPQRVLYVAGQQRWRTGAWDQSVDRVKVTLVSPSRMLHRIGHGEDEKNMRNLISVSFDTDWVNENEGFDRGKAF